jgi:vitamin B12 transporter
MGRGSKRRHSTTSSSPSLAIRRCVQKKTLLDRRLSFDVTYFDQDFSDLIAFDFVTFLPQNIAAAEVRGIEAQLQYRPNEVWHLTLAHTVSDSEDLATGRPLPRRPDHRSSVNLSFKPSARLTGSATWIWVQQRIDSDGSPMDDYHRLDLHLELRLPPARPGVQLNPYFKVQNLLDEDAAELNGFTTPGIQAALGLSLGV